MATIVNNPAPASSDGGGNGMGFMLGVVILVLFVLGLLYYGLPALRNMSVNPQINVPDKVNVNITQPTQ